MKTMFKKRALAVLTAICLVVTANYAAGESLFDYYTNAPTETLFVEASDMSTDLKTVFSQGSVNKQQQKIDFAEYFPI